MNVGSNLSSPPKDSGMCFMSMYSSKSLAFLVNVILDATTGSNQFLTMFQIGGKIHGALWMNNLPNDSGRVNVWLLKGHSDHFDDQDDVVFQIFLTLLLSEMQSWSDDHDWSPELIDASHVCLLLTQLDDHTFFVLFNWNPVTVTENLLGVCLFDTPV
ncbi:hypothetical protein WICPIJ_004766 [Wickerhamomyces pijperi]|uniref:Uncharacterized protein n=1 Tax=Wickerhamomyces pijperi TaxID=599730 RepID=A0A9P8Q537_WICPI|nr:hypothetical protein WICPIJ_004766 [Wickerhamomyces pijperi]